MPGLGRLGLWAQICQCAHRCSFCQGKLGRVLSGSTHPLVERENLQLAIPPAPKPNQSCIKAQRGPLLCADGGSLPQFPRVHQQLCRADGLLHYGGLIFMAPPQRSHLSCEHLCLPPAGGQGSSNRRGGGLGPRRTAPQLSRCGEGAGRGSAPGEERPNEAPGDRPVNQDQLGYSTFKPKTHISKIKFKTPGKKSRRSKSSPLWTKRYISSGLLPNPEELQ